jgi:hypothetical protein
MLRHLNPRWTAIARLSTTTNHPAGFPEFRDQRLAAIDEGIKQQLQMILDSLAN